MNISYFTVSVDQESKSSLAGWFWVRIFLEVAVKLLAGASVISRLDWGWWICFQAHTLCYWHTLVPHELESLSSLPHEPCHRAVGVSLRHGGWLPPEQADGMCASEWETIKMEATVFLEPNIADIRLLLSYAVAPTDQSWYSVRKDCTRRWITGEWSRWGLS